MAQRLPQGPPRGAQPGDVLVVVHDFDARSPDELTLRRGDRIELIELDDGFGDGWYLGKHAGVEGGNAGLFPGVYTAFVAGGLPKIVATSPPALQQSINTGAAVQPLVSPTNSPPSNTVRPGSPVSPVSPISPNDHTPESPNHVRNSSLGLQEMQPPSSQNQQPPPSTEVKRTSSVRSASASIPNIQRTIVETIGGAHNGEDSPVMNETLSVIDEHITDLSTPRHSATPHDQHMANDSASEYSSHHENRLSYMAGPETDEEDEGRLTEDEVKRWDHKQTAQYLRSVGVDPRHCDIFEEQEITGDVLLDMDQAFIYMKEYEFGVMGRRLKTWHKIRAFQDEVKGVTPGTRKPSLSQSMYDGSSEDIDRGPSRMGQTSTFLPRIPSLMEKSGHAYRQSRQQTPPLLYDSAAAHKGSQSPLNSQTARALIGSHPSAQQPGQESPSRPSASFLRDLGHSRRHSSIDMTPSPTTDGRPPILSTNTSSSHQKKPSFDRNWSMTSAVPTLSIGTPSVGTPPLGSLNQLMQQDLNSSDPNFLTSSTATSDLDRGYFSGGELDNRKARNVLRKRESGGTTHSRHSSFLDETKRSGTALKRHSRFGSADSIRDVVPSVTSPAAKAYHSNQGSKGRFRSASAKSATNSGFAGGISPTVTHLESGDSSPFMFPNGGESVQSSPLPSLTSKTNASKARRVVGLRAISDAVTGHEKALVSSPNSLPSPIKEDAAASPTRTGSSTPSAASKSFDNDTTDVSSKGTDVPLAIQRPILPGSRSKTKSKKETSAYVRGLLKKTPAEQRLDCDYSGWMKKKSSSLMTTWKPRLFFLKGRRLSYYYSEDDTEERGVIDISSHKVLVADSDTITTLHATITGATSSPVSPQGPLSPGSTENAPGPKIKSESGPFYFKLVPPKAGLSRAVQFTKPTVHYFQVDTIAEGRKWMGELLKATIEHIPEVGFETTNKQKTISLAKARARKERPPALKGEEKNEAVVEGPKSDETGLNIRGLSFDDEDDNVLLQNGHGHMKQNSLEAIGAFMARTASETGHETTA